MLLLLSSAAAAVTCCQCSSRPVALKRVDDILGQLLSDTATAFKTTANEHKRKSNNMVTITVTAATTTTTTRRRSGRRTSKLHSRNHKHNVVASSSSGFSNPSWMVLLLPSAVIALLFAISTDVVDKYTSFSSGSSSLSVVTHQHGQSSFFFLVNAQEEGGEGDGDGDTDNNEEEEEEGKEEDLSFMDVLGEPTWTRLRPGWSLTVNDQCLYELIFQFEHDKNLPVGEADFRDNCGFGDEAINGGKPFVAPEDNRLYHEPRQMWERFPPYVWATTGFNHLSVDWHPCGILPDGYAEPQYAFSVRSVHNIIISNF